MTDPTIAKTILEQLGGSRFRMMTGSRVQSVTDNSLTLKLTRNKASASFLKVTLEPSDTYTLEFTRVRNYELLPVKNFSSIYFDQLQGIFTEVTGLVTRL